LAALVVELVVIVESVITMLLAMNQLMNSAVEEVRWELTENCALFV
jgi:hypothetical protein